MHGKCPVLTEHLLVVHMTWCEPGLPPRLLLEDNVKSSREVLQELWTSADHESSWSLIDGLRMPQRQCDMHSRCAYNAALAMPHPHWPMYLEELVLKKLRCSWPLGVVLHQALGHNVTHGLLVPF